MGDAIDIALDVWRQGGFVMWVLGPATLVMWFGLGLRLLVLRRGRPLVDAARPLEDLVTAAREGKLTQGWGVIDAAVIDAVQASASARASTRRHRLDEVMGPYRAEIDAWGSIVKGAAIIAPLAGLLGTVTGMIATFDALGTGSMYTAGGGGIGAGIGEALVSTQSGLVVAVPGILLGALLTRKQHQLEDELDQLVEKLCADGGAA